jgi:cation:H+ antiporter
MIWIIFIAIAMIIIVAGSSLSLHADVLARKLNLSRSAMGVLLVSLVTTLPEIATTLGAVATVESPDLALGNNLGSVLFNLVIIAMCDLVFRQGGILRSVPRQLMMPAVSSFALLAVLPAMLLYPIPAAVGGVRFNAWSLGIAVLYLGMFFAVRKYSGAPDAPSAPGASLPSVKRAALGFFLSSVVVVVAGIGLAMTGERIAATSGLSRSFVGTLFLAVATSLPELAVGLSAARRGAFDLMVGNVLGANMLNVLVIGLADFVYAREALSVPANLSGTQVFSAAMGALATAAVIFGIWRRPAARRRVAGGISILLLVLYLTSLLVVYRGWIP